MTAAYTPQHAFEEQPLEDHDLEKLIENFETARKDAKPYKREETAAKSAFKERVKSFELPFGTYRCGPYIVKISRIEEKEIEFERSERANITFARAKTKR